MRRSGLERAWRTIRRHGNKCKNLRCRQTVALIGSALVQFSVGTATSMGNEVTYMVSYVRERGVGEPDLRYSDVTLLVFFGLLVSGFSSIPCGIITQKLGGWQAAALGSFFYTFSYVMGFIAIKYNYYLYYLVAVFMAVGVTLATIGALTEAIKWIPRWEGMVNGINYGAFAAAPAIVNPLVTALVNPKNLPPSSAPYEDKTEKYFSNPEVLDNFPKIYYYAVISLTCVQIVGIAFLARYPCQPEDALEAERDDETISIISESTSSNPSRAARRRKMNEPKHELEVKQTLSLPIFWKIFFLFSFSLAPVLTALAIFKVYGQFFIADDMFLARVGGSLGVAKGFGAFSWGVVADFMYLEGLILVMTMIVTAASVLVYISQFYGKVVYVIAFVTLFLAGGGIFSLYPVILVRYFGRKNFATLYGIALTSVAVAAVCMALVTLIRDRLYTGWFVFWMSLAFIASLAVWIAFYLHVLDYRGVRSQTVTVSDVRTVDQNEQEMTNIERDVPPIQREQVG